MKKILSILTLLIFITQPTFGWSFDTLFNPDLEMKAKKEVAKLLNSQVKYANQTNFNKFISTYDSKYVNSDGFNLEVYSKLIKDIWNTYDNIKYNIEIKDIKINGNNATATVVETSFAKIALHKAYEGELKSYANSRYTLKKINGKWKVTSDAVIDETTTMLYGNARDLDIKLTCPTTISANTDYTATLEFTPPENTVAIASIASDKVEFPQKPTKEVFRTLPDDNILERIFTSNNENLNEYIVASIGLTKTSICDLDIKLSLTGFGYTIKRVNVIPETSKEINDKI